MGAKLQISAGFVRYLCKNYVPSLSLKPAKHLSTCLSLIAPLKSMTQLTWQQDTDQGFTLMDALCLIIKNNFYLGAQKSICSGLLFTGFFHECPLD